jgi:hypothetical protein
MILSKKFLISIKTNPMTSTLIRGSAHESEKAKKELKKTKVSFREVFSSSQGRPPILITQSSAYPYIGYDSIREYCSQFTSKNGIK